MDLPHARTLSQARTTFRIPCNSKLVDESAYNGIKASHQSVNLGIRAHIKLGDNPNGK
jgi:hypothetical protein